MNELRDTGGWLAPPDPVFSLTDSPAYVELVHTMLGHAIEVTRSVRGGVLYATPPVRPEEEKLGD